jgi:nuclear GTP-binding protein
MPRVIQNLKSLIQKNTFIPEDIQKLDVEFEEDEVEESSVQENAEEEDGSEMEDVELKWDDVFEGINLNSVAVTEDGMFILREIFRSSEYLLDAPASPRKEPRMKTGKVTNNIL